MLNRRILRAKTFNALYAYWKAREANRLWCVERMKADFEPDWLATTPPNLKALEDQYEEAQAILLQLTEQDTDNPEVEKKPSTALGVQALEKAFQFYEDQVEKDRVRTRRQMVEEAEGVYQTYLLMLQLIVELADYAQEDAEKRKKRVYDRQPVYENEYKLVRNQWIEKLRNLDDFKEEKQVHGANWSDATISEWYEKLESYEWYQVYQGLPESSFEQDWQLVDDLVRKFMFSDEAVVEFFDERNIQWSQNRPILRNMMLRTLKNAKSAEEELSLQPLAKDWESDRDFFEDLFDEALLHEKEHDEYIESRLQNWELDRVALTDRLILQLALTELFHFQSIPTKVTINEYVELTKKYSPPKSREFINGLLDRLVKSLTAEGKIRKSGRGLIDNK